MRWRHGPVKRARRLDGGVGVSECWSEPATRRPTLTLDVYLNYAGNCEDAFRFYERHLGGRIVSMLRHGEGPGPARVPADWLQKIMHAHMELGGTVLMGADIPNAERMRSAYLSLSADGAAEAERIYALLAEGGEIFMKMEETFFAERFAMLRDRFGTSWMLMARRQGERATG